MDIQDILNVLPHRYPFLLVDRVLECNPGESLVAIKNVTFNEPFFQGHFPQQAVMPGVLILEALAQACGLLAFRSHSAATGNDASGNDGLIYLLGIDNARFKRPVQPGDRLRLEALHKRTVRGIWMFASKATVDDVLVAEADIMCTMREG